MATRCASRWRRRSSASPARSGRSSCPRGSSPRTSCRAWSISRSAAGRASTSRVGGSVAPGRASRSPPPPDTILTAMTIVDCAVYEDGCRRAGELPLEAAGDAAREDDDAFVWIGLYEPSAEEFDAVQREFDLHELAVEDAIHAHQRPKVELYGDTLLVVLKTVREVSGSEDLETGEILIFINRAFVVTVRHGQSELHDVRLQIEQRPDLLRFGTGAVLYAIVDRIVDDYEPVVQAVGVDIQEVEHDMFSPERTNPAERIYAMEREVLDLHRAVTPLAPAIDKLARGELIHPELRTYFRDVHDHLLRLIGRIEGFRDLLSSALQANLTQATVRQNEDMRKISAWVAILAVPTGVAAIYGMNFTHMPELQWRFGYPGVLILIVCISAFLYWRFRRSGWL